MSRVAYVGPALLLLYAALRSIDVVAQAYLMDPHYYWLGAQIVAQGGDPYDAATWDAAVRASFAAHGAAVTPPWPFEFRYPLWTAVAFLPFAALPLRAATALWQTMLIVATVAGAVLALRAAGAPPRARALFLTLVLASQPFIFTVIVGQFGGVMLLAAAAYAVLAAAAQQAASGLALSALALKPHVTVALVPIVLADLVARRRWVAIATAAVAVGALVAVSLVLSPSWPLAWLTRLTEAGAAQPNGANLTGVFTTFGIDRIWALAAVPVVLAVAAGVLWLSPRAPIDFVAVGACVSLLVTPYSGSHDHMLLAPAWARTLAVGLRSPALPSAVLLGGLLLVATLLPWALYAFALRARPDEALNGFVPLAGFLLLTVAYAITRRLEPLPSRNMP